MLQLLYMEYPADPKGHSFAEAAKQRSAYTGWRSGGQLRAYDLLDEGVDAISIGEGEQSVWEYITMLEEAKAYPVSGIYTKQYPNTEYRKTDLAWLERFEAPYFMEMDEAGMDRQYFYLETSRGCPYGCTYCLSSADRAVRMFSMEYIMRILHKLKDSRVTQVKLLDRTFNADPSALCRLHAI